MTAREAESLLSEAHAAFQKKNDDEALEKYHSVLERAESVAHKSQALAGLAEIASPESLPKIAPYCKNVDQVIRGYKDLDTQLKKGAVHVFLAIGDELSVSDKTLALRMMNRAINFADPEDLETLEEVMIRIRRLRGDTLSER